jgi:hypothetical protein
VHALRLKLINVPEIRRGQVGIRANISASRKCADVCVVLPEGLLRAAKGLITLGIVDA